MTNIVWFLVAYSTQKKKNRIIKNVIEKKKKIFLSIKFESGSTKWYWTLLWMMIYHPLKLKLEKLAQ